MMAVRGSHGHEDGLADGGSPFVQTGVGNLHPGQSTDQALKLEEGLQTPLTGFGLVGRVGRVELAAGRDAAGARGGWGRQRQWQL